MKIIIIVFILILIGASVFLISKRGGKNGIISRSDFTYIAASFDNETLNVSFYSSGSFWNINGFVAKKEKVNNEWAYVVEAYGFIYDQGDEDPEGGHVLVNNNRHGRVDFTLSKVTIKNSIKIYYRDKNDISLIGILGEK